MKLNVTSSLGRPGWALVGALVFYVLADREPIRYPEVIVPAARIIEREVPSGPPTIIERIRYVYLTPAVRAVAPGAVTGDVARFCRPVVVADTGIAKAPTPSVIRSVDYRPALVPLVRDRLLVTSMDGYGDLVAEDYSVRAPFGIAAGLEAPYHTTVRYPRWAVVANVGGDAAKLYGIFRFIQDVVR